MLYYKIYTLGNLYINEFLESFERPFKLYIYRLTISVKFSRSKLNDLERHIFCELGLF